MPFIKGNLMNRGFTLVELLVTISIFVILTGVVLFNQGRFNSSILLTNLAYDTALTVRQAQTYGINIKQFGTNTFVPYGVHFEAGPGNKSFILFADNKYNPSDKLLIPYRGATTTCLSAEGCVNRYNIKSGNSIFGLCATNNSSCTATSADSKGKLDIMFQRPNPDAIIYADGNTSQTFSKASIFLQGSDGVSIRQIDVQSNGLIQIVQ